jgi:site-specific recombinase XerD
MPTINFFTRTKAKHDKLTPVYCRFKAGRQIDMTVKSGLKVQPDQFNNNTGLMRNVAEANGKDDINRDIRNLGGFVYDEFARITDYESVPKDWLEKTVDKFWHPEKYKERSMDLFTFIQDFIDKAPSRVNSKSGTPVCYKMQREYERTFHYLKEYAKSQPRKLDFKDIDLDFYYSFVEYLQGLDLATNTIGKKIQTLKIFLNAASDLGYNDYKYYKSTRFVAITEESDSIYLTSDEIKQIYQHDFSDNKSLDRIRDLFIVGCWTGLRFSDISQVTPEVIKDGLITIRQAKTGGKVVIPLHHTVEAILKKYKGVLPRVPTNQEFNRSLKDIGKAADIKDKVHISITKGGVKTTKAYQKYELMTTHTGRRSFATNNYLIGVPSLTIMAITGHKTESAFLRYIKVTPTEHAERIRTIWQNQVKLKAV